MTTPPHAYPTSPSPANGPSTDTTARIAARLDRIPPNRFHLRLAALLGTGTFFDGFNAISIAVVLTAIITTLHLSLSTASLIISAGYLGQFTGALIIGALSEHLGRRPTFALCLISFGLLSVLAALSWNATSLLTFRLLQGIGLGAEVPLAATLMNEYLGTHTRGRIGTLYQSLFGWGLLFPPLIALLLTNTLGPHTAWRYLFAIGAIPVLVGLYAWFRLPESARWLAAHGHTEQADALVTRVETAAHRHGDTLTEPEPEPATRPTGSHPTVTRQDFHPSEILHGLYRNRTLMLWAAWFLASFVNYGCTVWLPTLYIRLGGASPRASLLLTALAGAISVACALVGASLIDRIGRRRLLIASFAIMLLGGAVGALGVGVFALPTLPVLIVAGAIIAAGAPLALAPLWIYTPELYPTRMRSWATSVASSMNRAASIASPLIIGAVLAADGGVSAIFSIMLGCAALGVIIMVTMGVETRARSLEDIAP